MKSSIVKSNDAGGAARPSSAEIAQMPGQRDAFDQQIRLAGDVNKTSPSLAAEKGRLSLEKEKEQEGTASHGPTPRGCGRGRSCRARGVSDGSWRDNRTPLRYQLIWRSKFPWSDRVPPDTAAGEKHDMVKCTVCNLAGALSKPMEARLHPLKHHAATSRHKARVAKVDELKGEPDLSQISLQRLHRMRFLTRVLK